MRALSLTLGVLVAVGVLSGCGKPAEDPGYSKADFAKTAPPPGWQNSAPKAPGPPPGPPAGAATGTTAGR